MNEKLIQKIHTSQKGITIIALVVTIIILLIIAGITINMVLGEDGIIKQVEDATVVQEVKAKEEQLELKKTEIISESYKDGKPTYLKTSETGELLNNGKPIEGASIDDGVLNSNFSREGSDLGKAVSGTVILPEGITKIGIVAFGSSQKIKNLVIPEGVTSIEQEACYGCAELENVIFPKTLTNISHYAFMECKKLKEVILPANLNSIGNYAFSGCVNLEKELQIPASVTSIGKNAFNNCGSLEKVVILCDGVDDLTKKSTNYPWGLNEAIIEFVKTK